MSHFKPSGVVRRTELVSVSGGSHVVVICSHGNLHDDGSKETTHTSSKVTLQFLLVSVHVCVLASISLHLCVMCD